ncbi:hypothetical protein AB1Y20_000005 [Prymnesium parvum]|uniref:Uncharacterized protein n=1 Tax=Prymnesium parvum TaxID=97485 RepID=A0AB34K6K6_PRYPA
MEAPLCGRRVTLAALKARPELNGLKAEVLSFDESSGRYTVRLQGSGEQLAVRAANLRAAGGGAASGSFAPGERVTIKGLTAKAELNGHSGTVTEWHEESGRYAVQVDNVVKPLLLRGDNLKLVKAEGWAPAWRTPEGQAAIDQALHEHVQQEWEKTKNSFGGMFGG